jgi:hypothetical protein
MNRELRLDAEIVPNQSLGGLALRTKVLDVQELFSGLGITSRGSFTLVRPFEARYRFAEGEIEAAVDVRNGKVFKLTARSGYKGSVFGTITVGMSVAEAMSLEPRLYYDEAEELIFCRGVEGLSIDVPEIDSLPELVPGMTISAISVYAEEIGTSQGQNGEW